MTTRVIEHEDNPPESGHDRQEEGVDEEVPLMEEDMLIEQREALQISIPQNITP